MSYKTKKKHHTGNQHCKSRYRPSPPEVPSSEPRPISPETPKNKCESSSVKGSSSKKLPFDYFDTFNATGIGNCIFDITLLSNTIKEFVKCKFCDSTGSIELIVCNDDNQSNGLVLTTKLICRTCSEYVSFKNSNLSADGNLYDLNLKFVYAMRSIGKGPSAGNELCVLLDLPKPPQKYGKYHKALLTAVKSCAEDTMKKATDEAIQENAGCTDRSMVRVLYWEGFRCVYSF